MLIYRKYQMKSYCADNPTYGSEEPEGIACCQESRCQVESLVSIDERGQMVIPKEVRDRAKIKAGDKLALISWSRGDDVICFSLMKADDLGLFIKDHLGPVMGGTPNIKPVLST
jgi:antitoxin PrlF